VVEAQQPPAPTYRMTGKDTGSASVDSASVGGAPPAPLREAVVASPAKDLHEKRVVDDPAARVAEYRRRRRRGGK